jgi:hypothetical protein
MTVVLLCSFQGREFDELRSLIRQATDAETLLCDAIARWLANVM